MQSVFNKHGESSFSFEMLEPIAEHFLFAVEQSYLDFYFGKPGCLNIARDACASMKGTKHDVATRMKMSERARNRTPEQRERYAELRRGKPALFAGRKHTDEAKAKNAAAHAGKKQSEETKATRAQKMREAWASGAFANRATKNQHTS